MLAPPKAKKITVTPIRLRAVIRKPDTAPPRRATLTASVRFFWAAAAQRTLDLTAMYMPMKPERPEQIAPTRNASEVCQPIDIAS